MGVGWIKLYRKLEKWEWYLDSHMVHLFIHMMFKANRETKQWQGITIERGQFISGRKTLSTETGISEQTIRTCIKRLKSTNELTNKTTNKYTVFTVVNYDLYQSKEEDNQQTNQQLTSNQPTTNQQPTTTKEYKEVKNKRNIGRFTPPTCEQVFAYAKEANLNVDAKAFVDYYASKGWVVGKAPMKDWKAAARGWSSRQKKTGTDLKCSCGRPADGVGTNDTGHKYGWCRVCQPNRFRKLQEAS